jgi:hypothetical protein
MKRPKQWPDLLLVGLTIVAFVALFALILGASFAFLYMIAWCAQYVLAAFGVHVSVWVCVAALVVVSAIANMFKIVIRERSK